MDANGWIPVSERLPESWQNTSSSADVLAYAPENVDFYSGMFTAYYDHIGKQWCDSLSDDGLGNVTHWQPLPPPPVESTP